MYAKIIPFSIIKRCFLQIMQIIFLINNSGNRPDNNDTLE